MRSASRCRRPWWDVAKAKAARAEVMIAQVIPPDEAALWTQLKGGTVVL